MSLAESVRQRLLNLAKARDETFDLILTHYGLERLLYRISQSEWKEKFYLKGALLFSIWHESPHRPTRDIDLLGCGFFDMEYVNQMFHALCEMRVADDGVEFDPESIRCSEIREGDVYRGIRVKLMAILAGVRIHLQVDIGFGDSVTPEPEQIIYPTMLDFPAPRLYAYTKYTVVAEKFQAMVVLGMANSRMKDFYDIWMMSQKFDFSGSILCDSIHSTFKRRSINIPTDIPFALTDSFFEDSVKKIQWKAFVRKKKINMDNVELSDIVSAIKEFLMPPLTALQQGRAFNMTWKPFGPWQKNQCNNKG
ncbi:MAG: nucleotidyl transferase AbiEii/AbiGii toxin family protein [Candidatus Aminicenantes bacterium]|nr:nucleotidyl transferase AbiEii/AbiGii toxin family protein [Candidatus Aminicenantes bacterium]NIM78866.1 nucleotidyl transferase AbiEii/AbiGii toxin family protein [Candidatus Aminicenantes bacterium]NIN18122.1 nucleotidyl transferase AbiEii/AbiGii toxin family protein [Candidatus Aminicenantes bacterium]NIN42021.1 nucleotidyl transferase AbiEii/AbiGii toxin family protein [Candidatus Aminicenantes bacterium]NIN84777.1 nucleotidyl transferase AbiEii/AbiGii toxin family protein [Candidatus A